MLFLGCPKVADSFAVLIMFTLMVSITPKKQILVKRVKVLDVRHRNQHIATSVANLILDIALLIAPSGIAELR
jgi:hypothetical protein